MTKYSILDTRCKYYYEDQDHRHCMKCIAIFQKIISGNLCDFFQYKKNKTKQRLSSKPVAVAVVVVIIAVGMVVLEVFIVELVVVE